jgi:hypothetical protein
MSGGGKVQGRAEAHPHTGQLAMIFSGDEIDRTVPLRMQRGNAAAVCNRREKVDQFHVPLMRVSRG